MRKKRMRRKKGCKASSPLALLAKALVSAEAWDTTRENLSCVLSDDAGNNESEKPASVCR